MAGAEPPRARTAEHVGAAAAAVAAAVLMTWPLARHVTDHVLGAAYYWDAYANTMIMGGHVDAVLGRGPLSLYDSYYFAPLPHSIVFNENLFGLSLIFAPLYLVTGNPLCAYNLTLLSSLSLSAFFTYLLVRRLTGSGYAGVIAGVAFAFSPYVMFEIGRIQLVATQWIPACFLMLHRAIEEERRRDVVGFWLCYLLQIGTCLYYAMFLVPLLVLVAAMLLVRRGHARKLWVHLAAVGVAAALVAFAMVYPYFRARGAFSLERSLSFASSYDGKLRFFWNVHDTNRTLTAMHHSSALRGAHEEIAFPGFTVLAMLLFSLGVPLWREVSDLTPRKAGNVALRWLALAALAVAATLLTHSMLAGAVALGLGIWHETRVGSPLPFSGPRGLYLAVLLLSIAMFLGLSPMEWRHAPVHGLYYYFHTYFPGFDGIRKVSRQAVMTTFVFALLSSFGSSWLFSKLARPQLRAVVLCALLATSCYELRSFPHALQGVWAGATVPEAYRFVASLPTWDLVATVPDGNGLSRFRGDAGLALHDYLMLYHKHRSLNGQSSWLPPVTDLARGALRHLPDDGAYRILRSVGARYVVVHAEDLDPADRDLLQQLAARPEHYRQVFQQDSQSVFFLSGANDPTLELADTPTLPAGARPIAGSELAASASLGPERARAAIDGNPRTFWSTSRPQERGQYFELAIARPHRLAALEILTPDHLSDLPLSYELSVAVDGSDWQTAAEQPVLRVFRDQVYSPKTFAFRVVLPKPILADRVRITIAEPVPGHHFVIHEVRVYAQE
jgi:hypothetical protein